MRNDASESKIERSKAFNKLQSSSQNPDVPNASITCTLVGGKSGKAEQKKLLAQPLQNVLFKEQNVTIMHHTVPEQTYSGVKQDTKNDVRYQAANIANTGEVNGTLRFNGPGPLQDSNISASSAKILPSSKIPMPSINNVSSPKDTNLSKDTFLPSKVETCYDEMSSDKPTELISKNISSMLTMPQNVDKMLVKNTHEKSPKFDQHESASTLQELNKLSESLNGMDINKTRFKMQTPQLRSGNTTSYPLPQSSSIIQVDNSVMTDLYCIKKLEDINNFILALSSRESISCDIQSGIDKVHKNLSDLLDKFSSDSVECSSSECSSSYANNEMEINHDFHDDQLQTRPVKEENYQKIMHSIILESAKRGLDLHLTIYICKLCDKEMNCEDDADLHIKDIHYSSEMLTGFKWYFCKSCNLQIYGTESNYHNHNIDPCHLEVKSFKAEYASAVDCTEEAEVSDTSVISLSNTVTVGKNDFKKSTDRKIKLSGFANDEQIKLSALSRQESINVSPSVDNREPQIHGGDEVEKITATCEQQVGNERNYNEEQSLLKKLEVASTCQMKDDTASVSSTSSAKRFSKIRPRGPHEILISIARGKAGSNSDPVGLFCQVCGAYQLYGPKYPNHYIDVRHIKKMNEGKKKQPKKYHCHACNIDLFGDWNIMRTHNKLPMHNESVSLKNSSVESKSECNLPNSPVEQPPKYNICGNPVDEPPKNNLSGKKIENGNNKEKPYSSLMSAQKQVQMHVKLASVHQVLMKDVLKRYIDEHTEDTLGFCCFICEAYFLDEDQWLTHLSRPEHGERHRVNKHSAFFAVRDCLVCQVRFICDENMLAEHEESPSHMAVKQLKARKLSRGTETDEDEESSDDWSDDEFPSDVASNVSSNNAKSNQNARTEPNSNNSNSTVTNINNSKSTQPKNTVNKKGIFLIGEDILQLLPILKQCTPADPGVASAFSSTK